MPLFDDPELNQLFDEHAPGEGAASGTEAKDPNPDTVGNQAKEELAKRKKCKSIEEELFSGDGENPENPGDDDTPGENEEDINKKKGGKKHKSDIADLFSDDLFKDGDNPTDSEPEDGNKPEDDEDEDDDEIAEESALLISEAEAALDFDL